LMANSMKNDLSFGCPGASVNWISVIHVH
jgi:hypothetical protein